MKKIITRRATLKTLFSFEAEGWKGGRMDVFSTFQSSFLPIFLYLISFSSFAQSWTAMTNFGGSGRYGVVAFSIGTKGYIGLGTDATGNKKDFWEWNQSTNTWAQKANFGGTARTGAVGVGIGTKGYVGLGNDGTKQNDWWEWNQSTDTWTVKAPCLVGRSGATGFVVGTKAYVLGGIDSGNFLYGDTYEWDQTSNTWTAKSTMATARYNAVAFTIGNYGYAGTGTGGGNVKLNDFWQYDPSADVWTQKANFGGTARATAAGFAMAGLGYIGTGYSTKYENDMWQYTPTGDTWAVKASFPGTARISCGGLSVGNCGYIGLGYDGAYKNDFWQFGSCASGVNEPANENLQMQVYPNPSTGQFQIQIGNGQSAMGNEYKIEIYNVLGEKVTRSVIPSGARNLTIDLSAQPEGIYFVKVTAAQGSAVKKIIISR